MSHGVGSGGVGSASVSGDSHGFSPEEWDEIKRVLRELGQRLGHFDANEATGAILEARLAQRGAAGPFGNSGDDFTVIGDLVDLGYLLPAGRRDGNGPLVWEWVEQS